MIDRILMPLLVTYILVAISIKEYTLGHMGNTIVAWFLVTCMTVYIAYQLWSGEK